MGGEKAAAAAVPLTKNQRRRLKKKAEKKKAALHGEGGSEPAKALANGSSSGSATDAADAPDVEVEYVSMDMSKELALPEDDPAYEEFMRILGKFSTAEQLCGPGSDDEVSVQSAGSSAGSGAKSAIHSRATRWLCK